MPWCPVCKDEYKEGVKVCADCGAELVDDLSLISENSDDDNEDILSEIPPFEYDEGDDEDNEIKYHQVYVGNAEKAEDNRTSAYTLLPVGIIGLILIILFFLGIIPGNMSVFGKNMITGVMGTLFILFIIMGVLSMKSFKSYKAKAKSESSLTDEIIKWCKESFTKESIDKEAGISESASASDTDYFAREEYIRGAINKKFMNLDEAYVDTIIEQVYSDIFEK